MTFLQKIDRLPWKYIITANVSIVALAFTFISIATVQRPTENRSRAKEPLPSPILFIRVDTDHPPRLINPDVDWGKVGDAIVIRGENLGNVPFGRLAVGSVVIPADRLIEWKPDQIVFTIPEGAVTAPVTLEYDTVAGKTGKLSTERPLVITKTNQL